jgi:signal peptidase I
VSPETPDGPNRGADVATPTLDTDPSRRGRHAGSDGVADSAAPGGVESVTTGQRGRHVRRTTDPQVNDGTLLTDGSASGSGSGSGSGEEGTGGSGPGGEGGGGPGDGGPGGGGASGGGNARRGRTPAQRRKRSARRWIVEWVVIILIALVVAFVVRTYVAQTFFVPSTSMYPTLKAGDRIVVDKLAYDLHSIHRGDIVVFKRPPAEQCGGPLVPDLVKRVVGLPDEWISARGGHVYITGKLLSEPWLPEVKTTYTANFGPVHVPSGQYFVMGDNRVNSCDSRMWGTVKRSYIVGKVDLIIWPLSQFHFF